VGARLNGRSPRRVAVACAAVAAAAAANQGTAAAAPQLLSVRFVRPPTIGRTAQLQVQAADPGATVSDISVAFGHHEGSFGIGACRAPDSSGAAPGGPFGPGATSTFTVPHVFGTGGPRPLLIQLGGDGCSQTGPTLVERLTVTPNKPGQPASPLPPPAIVAVTGLPGTPLPTQPPQIPSIPGVPQLPGLPAGLPTLPTLPTLPRVESAAAPCPGANAIPAPRHRSSATRARAAVLCLLNAQRRAFGERPLKDNRALDRAAALHDSSMVAGGFFSHVDPGGGTLVDRLRRVHFITASVRWIAGENLGFGVGGASTPAALVRAWMASPEHRSNILDPSFNRIGIALAKGVPGAPGRGVTYTTDFGARS